MSSASHVYLGDYEAAYAAQASSFPLPRWKLLPLPFLIPTAICFISWSAGGLPWLTDIGFIILTAFCACCLLMEIVRFPQRYGIGGIVLFGGVIVWFCHDYCSTWLGYDFRSEVLPFGPELIARTACFYSLFVTLMVAGLLIPKGRWLVNLILRAPDPNNSNIYLCTWAMMVIIGLLPFSLFTAEGLIPSMLAGAFGNVLGTSIIWTVGRTGNFNYNWGGYVAQIVQVGQFTSVFGIFCSIFIFRSKPLKALTWLNWLFWLLYIFQTGRRGDVAALTIPAIGFLYIKLQLKAAQVSGTPRQSILAYVVVGLLVIGTLFVVQYQGYFRGTGLNSEDFSEFELFKNQGNSMFSEALVGFQLIPAHHPFFRDDIPGEGAILALPETFVWFCIGPFPRALWTTKPEDPAMIWYNAVVAGGEGREGTTISQGLVGHWYFRYGLLGMMEGALLVGWLMSITERVLQNSGEKPLGILYSLVLAAWLFRIYRNFYFNELYAWMIGAVAFALLVIVLSPFAKPNA